MSATSPAGNAGRRVRDTADGYVDQLAALNPIVATSLGRPEGQDRLPDLSPAGEDAEAALRAATLASLTAVEAAGPPADPDERRCARLLRERLESEQAMSAAGEHLRAMSNIFGPPQQVRQAFLLMPATTAADWATIGRRMAAVPGALAGYRASLTEGARRGLYAAPRQVQTVADQLAAWQPAATGTGWFGGFAAAADVPPALRADLDRATASADAAVAELRDWLRADYLPGTAGHAGRGGTGPVPHVRAALAGREPGPDRGVRVGLGAVPGDHGADDRRGGHGAAGRQPARGDAPPRLARPDHRRRRRDQEMAAGPDGHRDGPAGRHPFRAGRSGPGRAGNDRAAGQRGGAVLHRAVAGLLPAGPDLAADDGPARRSRCGGCTAPGTTRAFPATTCSSRSGRTWPASSRRTRRPSAA